jgi:hypothetical protein
MIYVFFSIGGEKGWFSTPRTHNSLLGDVLTKVTGDPCPYILNSKDYFPSPRLLLEHELPVRCHVQQFGDIVVTLPAGYHFGINRTFCLNVACNYGDVLEWPPYGIRLQLCDGGSPCNKSKAEK